LKKHPVERNNNQTHHHALKDVGLIIDVVEHVFPKHIQRPQGHHEAAHTHPQPVDKRRHGQCHDEDGRDIRHEHDKAFGGQQIQKQPQDPRPEANGRRPEVGEPVRDDGEGEADEEEVGEADEEVGEGEGQGPVQAVGALFAEAGEVFKRGGDVGDRHEAMGESEWLDVGSGSGKGVGMAGEMEGWRVAYGVGSSRDGSGTYLIKALPKKMALMKG
jgi:hypothetical protein